MGKVVPWALIHAKGKGRRGEERSGRCWRETGPEAEGITQLCGPKARPTNCSGEEARGGG